MVIGGTYAFLTLTLVGTKKNVINAGVLDLVLEEGNEITISDALPMYDEVGMIQEDVFIFRLANKTSNPTNYVLKLEDIQTGTLAKSDVKYGLIKNGETTISLLSNLTDGIIDTGTIEGSQTNYYELRLWIKDSVTEITQIEGKFLALRLSVDVSQQKEGEFFCESYVEKEPNEPVLTNGMIAVTYNETEKTWIKADTSTSDWYDYDNQIWANAVTVTKDTRDTYMALDAGEPISMNDINTMWVWIPRYSYTIMQPYGRTGSELKKCSDLEEITVASPANCRDIEYPTELRSSALAMCQDIDSTITTEVQCLDVINSLAKEQNMNVTFNNFEEIIDFFIEAQVFEDTRILKKTYPENNYYETSSDKLLPGAIDIKFISRGEKDTGTGQCTTCIDNWVTPEGFTFGNEEVPGFWVGKFETTGDITDVCYTEECTDLLLTVKPNLIPVSADLANLFYHVRSMQNSYNAHKYGFDLINKGSMDTHLMKNTEWGIVAMLAQSKYGKYGNNAYEGTNKEVYPNMSFGPYVTGYSNGTADYNTKNTQVAYDIPDIGYGASTTGTIYGVYDMNGGADEYVMGNFNNYSGQTTQYFNSGFCGKLTDGSELTTNCAEWPESKYYDLYTSYTNKVGDATLETSSWYNDTFAFEYATSWLKRGGTYLFSTFNTGLFYSFPSDGDCYDTPVGGRIVIKP